MIRATVQRFGATLVLACALAGCAAPKSLPPTAAPDLSRDLAAKVTGDGMFAHLRALQTVADSNGGNRATGTPGYDASLDYVVKALKAKGFEVTTPEFQRLYTVSEGKPTLTVAGRSYSVDQASLLVQTPPGGLAGPPVRPSRSDGCAVADYPPALPDNAIAVVDDTGCSVVDKHNSAVAKGAAGLIVISAAPDRGSSANLFGPGYYNQLKVPVAVVGASGAAALARTNAPIRLVLDTENIQIKSRNVLAQTKTGTPDEVVMVGARLDSPPGSPGINSAGSGVAAVLETALQLGPLPPVTNAVRFAFWGGRDQWRHGLRLRNG